MLTTLVIKDFAIISHLELQFGPGMSVLTGETGAGKSIVINAVKLLLGDRGQVDVIRAGAGEAVIEGMFLLEGPHRVSAEALLASMGVDISEGEFSVRRVIPRAGRGRVYIGGTLQTIATLRSLMRSLVDISGQHEHVGLVDAARHLSLVDRFGGHEVLASAFSSAFGQYQQLRREYETLVIQNEERAKRLDYLDYQLEELTAAAIKPGESEQVSATLKRVCHAEALRELVDQSVMNLYDSDEAVVAQLGSTAQALRRMSAHAPELSQFAERLEEATMMIEDCVRDLRGHEVEDASAAHMDALQARLSTIDKFERKYRIRADEFETYVETLLAERETLMLNDAREIQCLAQMKVFEEQLMEQAHVLSGARRQASERLAAECTAYLRLLAMPHAQIEVRVETLNDFSQFRQTGADGIELLLRANAGEDAKPLAKVASGGELSRVLLAIKRVLVDKDEVACYIFDEVDTGIGGATATHVATMLREVSRSHQVLCITHL
ncbi:MAG: DNA repair protein RecN, partial [Proteobacteria bacterium]|nr:DNA repair protein RecN [Pseudomonadota bacterium]